MSIGRLIIFIVEEISNMIKTVNGEIKQSQGISEDLSICVRNSLPKVSSLPKLLAINLMKVEIQIFQTVIWPYVGDLIKGSCLRTSYTKLVPWCGIDTSSADRDMYFICSVTPKDDSVEMSCKYMGESSLQHVTTLKCLVIIGIPIVKSKNASSVTRIL